MAIQKKRLCIEFEPPVPPSPALPDDIIFRILLILPVKSLVRFSCVCKNWSSMMRSQIFFKLHSESQSERYLLFEHYPHESPKSEKLFTTLSHITKFPIDTEFDNVIGSCNGLCLLQANPELCLWNPAIRKYKFLPSTSLLFEKCISDVSSDFGESFTIDLGFDSITNDYKILITKCVYNTRIFSLVRMHIAEIYSLSLNSWRGVEMVGLDHLEKIVSYSAAFTNGAFYWLAAFNTCEYGEEIFYWSILSFDLFEERFEEIKLPEDLPFKEREIGVFRGLLAVLSFTYGSQTCCIWTMMKGGFWSKLQVELPEPCRFGCCCVGDYVVLPERDKKRVCVFDPQTLQTKDMEITSFSSVHVYTKSFALL